MEAVALPDVPALTSGTATGWIGPDGTVGIFTRDDTNAVTGHVIVEGVLIGEGPGESARNAGLGSAEIAAPGPDAPSRHLHSAETYGDGFYVGGSRHKHARCRTCGEELEPRRVG